MDQPFEKSFGNQPFSYGAAETRVTPWFQAYDCVSAFIGQYDLFDCRIQLMNINLNFHHWPIDKFYFH